MATTNKLIPIIAALGVAIVGVVVYKQFSGSGAVKPGAEMTSVPDPDLPRTAGADSDTPAETLRMVATSNAELRSEVAKVIERNNQLIEENARLKRQVDGGGAGASAAQTAPAAAAPPPQPAERSAFDSALDTAAQAADTLARGFPSHTVVSKLPQAVGGSPAATPGASIEPPIGAAPGEVSYSLMPPMGYAVATEPARGGNVPVTRFVRTTHVDGVQMGATAATGPAGQAAQAAAQRSKEDIPYFTLPENATLSGVTAMTSIIGRVPIDGRVTDPMQFKAVIGRDNLAANGFELPTDIAGMIVTGVAIGDMALSCSEGKIRSATFVFNDGAIRTVSARNRSSSGIGGGGSITGGGSSAFGASSTGNDLGFISDMHGNPCIPGKFVTNAPAYLTDIIGLSALGVAGQAYADAQRTIRNNADGSSSSNITGSVGDYALGQAVAGGTNEVTKWMLQRLKNSFDAVVTPSGHQLVVHLDRELRIDKAQNPRRLIHRQQSGTQIARGAHHGLE